MAIIFLFNSLVPCGAIWRHRSGSTLAQVMACCLTAPSHYLNQCWLILCKIYHYQNTTKGKLSAQYLQCTLCLTGRFPLVFLQSGSSSATVGLVSTYAVLLSMSRYTLYFMFDRQVPSCLPQEWILICHCEISVNVCCAIINVKVYIVLYVWQAGSLLSSSRVDSHLPLWD